jgi:uncharacterized membrane protein
MPAMDSITRLVAQQPIVALHMFSALASIVVGSVLMAGVKGTHIHRVLGWTWVSMMAVVAASSFFIRSADGPNIGGFGPIHALTVLVTILLPLGIGFIRRGRVNGHRLTMSNLFYGACIVAGVFTLLPGRFLGDLVWKQTLGWIA